MLAILAAGAYVTYQLNLWGPMINMANAASAQALEEGKKRLREFLEASETGRHAMAMTHENSTSSYEMSRLEGSSGRRRRKTVNEDDDEDDI